MKDFLRESPLFAFLIVVAVTSSAVGIASQAIDAYVKTHTPMCCDCSEPAPKTEEKP